MGQFFTRFREQKTTIDILEDLDKKIKNLQRHLRVSEIKERQLVSILRLYSSLVYLVAAIIFFCVYSPATWKQWFLYSLPLLAFPVFIWGIKEAFHWYFIQRLSSNEADLEELKDRRDQLLEDVMETETYKKAREILERFDPERLRILEGADKASGYGANKEAETVLHQRPTKSPEQNPMRQRSSSAAESTPPPAELEQNGSALASELNGSSSLSQNELQRRGLPGSSYALMPRPPLPRSVLPQDRGVMDRLMDYLVGDGPEHRYALICWHCYSHNGMALKEEFEYLSFRCCYCYMLNPARKQRPVAPRLEFFAAPGFERRRHTGSTTGSDGDEDVNSGKVGRNQRRFSDSQVIRRFSPEVSSDLDNMQPSVSSSNSSLAENTEETVVDNIGTGEAPRSKLELTKEAEPTSNLELFTDGDSKSKTKENEMGKDSSVSRSEDPQPDFVNRLDRSEGLGGNELVPEDDPCDTKLACLCASVLQDVSSTSVDFTTELETSEAKDEGDKTLDRLGGCEADRTGLLTAQAELLLAGSEKSEIGEVQDEASESSEPGQVDLQLRESGEESEQLSSVGP